LTSFLPAAVSARSYHVAAVSQVQTVDLALCQRSPMPAWQIAKPKSSDSNAEKMFDAVSNDLEHAPNLAIDSLPQNNAKARRRQGMKPRNFRALAIKNNAAQQLRSEHRVPRSIQRDLVLFVYLEAGMREPLRQFTIIRQKQ
jgi:hypothetical protein